MFLLAEKMWYVVEIAKVILELFVSFQSFPCSPQQLVCDRSCLYLISVILTFTQEAIKPPAAVVSYKNKKYSKTKNTLMLLQGRFLKHFTGTNTDK